MDAVAGCISVIYFITLLFNNQRSLSVLTQAATAIAAVINAIAPNAFSTGYLVLKLDNRYS